MKIGAMIRREGTFVFTLPEESTEPVTDRYIQKHMIGWFWHGVNALNYLSEVQIERFFLQTYNAQGEEAIEEISSEEARTLYEMISNDKEKGAKTI